MANINVNVFNAHTPITLGRLRDGAIAEVARTARESSIGAKHFFSGARFSAALRGDPATRSTRCPVIVIFEAQWRAAFGTIVEAAVAEARAAHVAAAAGAGAGRGAAFDEVAARNAAAASAENRLEAIAIGSVRTALVESFEITDADLRAVEMTAATLVLAAPGAAATDADYLARMMTSTRGWNVSLASGHTLAVATPSELAMLNAAPLNADEVELAYALISMGQVSPVRAGAQLYEDGHHYHSDGDGSARHKAIEKEVLARATGPARNIWRANAMLLRNAVWHAAIHPVKEDILQAWAEDDDMPGRLAATGYGSMAVGLPAQEDLFRRAGSYSAVYTQVIQTATAHGHTITLTDMTATVNALRGIPRRGALPAQKPALPGDPAAPWPAGCTTRAKVLKLYLEPALDKAEPVASWMFGFFREICSRNGIRANTVEGSLLRSYSLKRAVANHLGEANRAQEMYSARARFIRAQGEEGKLETYTGAA